MAGLLCKLGEPMALCDVVLCCTVNTTWLDAETNTKYTNELSAQRKYSKTKAIQLLKIKTKQIGHCYHTEHHGCPEW